MSADKSKDISSKYFKNFMKFRKQTIEEISEHTGISRRTIQGYAQGKTPFCRASAENFISITDYLNIDPHYMLGKEEWKLSEYLENICREYNLKDLKEVALLRDDIRLTEQTQSYRKKKRKSRKLAKNCDVFPKLYPENSLAARKEAYLGWMGKEKYLDYIMTIKQEEKDLPKTITIETEKSDHGAEIIKAYETLLSEYIELFREIENSNK